MTVAKVKATTRVWMTEQPWLYPRIRSIQKTLGRIHRQAFCERGIDLCVEGYPACANSYLYFAFKECAVDELTIGHHTHSASNVKRALHYGIPVIIVFRDPKDAIPSYLSRFDKDPLEATIRYVRFYRYIRKISNRICLTSFSEVTSHVTQIIHRAASASKLRFECGDLMTLEERVRVRMNQQWSDEEDKLFNPRDIPLPNEDRKAAKKRAWETIRSLDVYGQAVQEYKQVESLFHQSISSA